MPEPRNTFTEEFQTTADKLIDTIRDLIHEGNVRHIVIKNPQGEVVIEIPVSISVVGLLIAPILAPIAAIAVLAADFTIVVTREGPPPPPPSKAEAPKSDEPGGPSA